MTIPSSQNCKTLMIQATGSDAGKSLLVAGLCRLFSRRGLTVRPFKPQNMSNNAAVTLDGGEIGRAQALQALACGVESTVHMNPVLLKPQSDVGAQLVVQGQVRQNFKAQDYSRIKASLMPFVIDSFERMKAEADLVVVEGAGSPAEVNLRIGDIANMGFALAANVPVILVGDIDRGGVIASLVGTYELLSEAESKLVKGFIVNKFRGDPALFESGAKIISQRTNWQDMGLVPWFSDAHNLPAEDALGLASSEAREEGALKIDVLRLPHIANFDDLDPLRLEQDIDLHMVQAGELLREQADLVILPGSKATLSDLAFVKAQGWDIDILSHVRRGGKVLGICGGYQMLGKALHDPNGVEGKAGSVKGLGLLDIETLLSGQKRLEQVTARHIALDVETGGYRMHIGQTSGSDCGAPVFEVSGQSEGAQNAQGTVLGSYIHGLFADDIFREKFLDLLGGKSANSSALRYHQLVDTTLNKLADHLEQSLDCDALLNLNVDDK